QVFGIFVSFGIVAAWLLSMTFLPAYAMLLPKESLKHFGITEEGDESFLARMLPKITKWSMHRARPVVIGTALLLVISAVGISRIVINDNPVNWFKASHPLRKADALMNNHMGGTYMSNLVFEGEPDSFKDPVVVGYMRQIQKFIDGQEGVGATTSVADVLEKISYEMKGSSALPNNYDEIAQDYFIYEMAGGDPDDLFTFITPEYDKAHIWVQMTQGDNLLMSGLVRQVGDYMRKHPLPAGIHAEWAGLNYINVVWQDRMVKGMLWNLIGSFIAVLVMMIFLFRSFLWGMLSMIPLTVTISFIYALIGFVGKPYDMPVAVLSSLTLGLSIDFAIHFIKRVQFIHAETGDFAETMRMMSGEPAKAITRNTLVIAIGFVPLFLASLVPYITVGVFFFVIMLFSGIATLIIMPALSTLMRNRLFGKIVPVHHARSEHVKNLTRKTATGLLAAILIPAGFSVLSPASALAETAEEIMKKSHLSYYYSGDDGRAEVEMTLSDDKGKSRSRKFTMLRKDLSEGGEQKYFIYFREPGDVRRMTFMVWKDPKNDDSRWMFIPSLDLVKRIAANDKRSSFVGSDFTYEDVSGRHWSEDAHSLEREETVDGKSAFVVKSVPRDAKSADYRHRLTWVDKQTWLPLKEEYFNGKGAVIKRFEAGDIRTIDGIPTISRRTMTDTVKNHKTVVAFSEIKYNLGIKKDIFTERYLRMPPNEYIAAGN
ncbi:MAG: outer membrane lipoprotein-sorting protein, partial [Candidatus Latescibacterota bacterium]